MKELEQYIVSRSIFLDHEQLLLLRGSPGTGIKLIYGGACLTHGGAALDKPSARRRSTSKCLAGTTASRADRCAELGGN